MLTKNAVAVAALAAFTEQAAAFNSHRHLHRQVDKRALETDWVTVWETVYVTAGQESIPAPTPDAPVDVPSVPDVEAPPAPPAPTTSSVTSTVIVVTPTEPAQEEEEQAAVPDGPQYTTLSTVAKPPAAEPTPDEPAPAPSPEPVDDVSVPPVLNPVQPDPTTSTAPPAETSTSSPPPSNGKRGRGLAYNDATMANAFDAACSKCGWAYNWGSSRGDLDTAIDYVPTLWGDQPLHTDHWDVNAETELGNGVKALFSFNEPDHATQSNISPEQAAASHIKFMNKYGDRALIGAPSVTNSGNPGEGLEWLSAFIAACDASSEGCKIDFCNVHWYSEAQYADTLFEHLEKAHEICGGKPVWLTEFAPLGSDEDISTFMTNIIPELDNIDYLDAYSYFMVSAGSLMSSSSSLSGYGQIYATV